MVMEVPPLRHWYRQRLVLLALHIFLLRYVSRATTARRPRVMQLWRPSLKKPRLGAARHRAAAPETVQSGHGATAVAARIRRGMGTQTPAAAAAAAAAATAEDRRSKTGTSIGTKNLT